jgi:hypothetical protein
MVDSGGGDLVKMMANVMATKCQGHNGLMVGVIVQFLPTANHSSWFSFVVVHTSSHGFCNHGLCRI